MSRKKARQVYEAPGATILTQARNALEEVVLDEHSRAVRQQLSHKYGELVYRGLWFSELRSSLDAFFSKCLERLTGTVRLRLYRGTIIVTARSSPNSLYTPREC
jgi:argininosuccinate synthase